MDLGLKGKVAIVTGGSRGIGRAIAMGLAAEGCRVAIVARGAERLATTVEEIRALGTEVIGVVGDTTRPEDVERLVRETVAAFVGIDILVNNVGGSRPGTFLETDDRHWQEVFELNLFSAIRTSRQVIPELRKRGGGRIVNISSIYGRESGGPTSYNAAKAAEISLTKALAREFGQENILVNTVAPGSILFPGGGWERRTQADPAGMAEFVRREMPLGRFGRPEEVAHMVVFLASERASLVNGACIPVDGAQGRSNI
ncbi:MAG: glucose 1-dehydrogenase [Chloroflexi bacterium]|nr:glucose 1-dehydrogenase [Chloroflexota bacterium]